jgi:hypothetical protein
LLLQKPAEPIPCSEHSRWSKGSSVPPADVAEGASLPLSGDDDMTAEPTDKSMDAESVDECQLPSFADDSLTASPTDESIDEAWSAEPIGESIDGSREAAALRQPGEWAKRARAHASTVLAEAGVERLAVELAAERQRAAAAEAEAARLREAAREAEAEREEAVGKVREQAEATRASFEHRIRELEAHASSAVAEAAARFYQKFASERQEALEAAVAAELSAERQSALVAELNAAKALLAELNPPPESRSSTTRTPERVEKLGNSVAGLMAWGLVPAGQPRVPIGLVGLGSRVPLLKTPKQKKSRARARSMTEPQSPPTSDSN